ncbi:23S rRNA (pseudouridine(1915)-N(3))-methyltransferase RlmH [Asticcacaulis sp. SL142]|uniref:23S rRNA (pseudouridine(1915)-N(3))-methyltransferase RlmH n=1 Tax=Asticcacaulis sp. SL142 TaxID=2995155 RepID=UPI00226D39CF|nr:23S rRNA (pseudouridine(1915)-N(3))-methyltransferase RlmH [Asticcacaulis sp. SL142]WAC47462.1 23S rRNA (pseudouridine(1915)-N(3))-methyltransferase RlmH [Asticcacaulis sp. SL142]
MKLILAAVGRLGSTPENALARDYLQRASNTGRALGLGPAELLEIETKKTNKAPTKAQEAEAILAALGEGVAIVTCDERGELLTSRQIATRIDKFKDRGERKMAFVIGGADGLDPELVKTSAFSLAFGPQTWPHALVRLMLAEQMYRATTILAGSPYHRD